MRKTISISISEELHNYVLRESQYSSVSEYIRYLIQDERQRRADNASRPITFTEPRHVNENFVLSEILEKVERLTKILEHR